MNTAESNQTWYCHYGVPAVVRLTRNFFSTRCFCPADFYGDRCQYQRQRISVALTVRVAKNRVIPVILTSLISDDHDHEEVQSYHLSSYLISSTSCEKTLKFLLLYTTRPKNISKHYFVKTDAFDHVTSTYLGSWRFPVPFLFLPVNPMALIIYPPTRPLPTPHRCPLMCGSHGRCLQYLNPKEFFCRCDSGWSGKQCEQPVNCDDCAPSSLCLGSHNNRSICLCSIGTFGSQCLLEYSCPDDRCENAGTCVTNYPHTNITKTECRCTEEFHATHCNYRNYLIAISFQDMKIFSYVIIRAHGTIRESTHGYGFSTIFAQKLRMFQTSVSFYSEKYPTLMAVLVDENYFIVADYMSLRGMNLSMIISPKHRCPQLEEIADPKLINLPTIQRIKYFHQFCKLHPHLMCFIGDIYFCQCTRSRDAICSHLNSIFECNENIYCLNGGRCIQDQLNCPFETFCTCSDCFFGERCQFYAKGLGLTLDDMLRYELRPATSFDQQPLAVKISSVLTLTMFVIGLVNSILSLMTFHSSTARQVGVGIYLYASSISSLLTVTALNFKFWFLIMTHIYSSISYPILRAGCLVLEPTLRLFLFIDNWLNACVAIERATTVFKGVNFNKQLSQRIARWTIFILPLLILVSLVHELIYRDLFYDEEEERNWCILEYSERNMSYSTFILSFHTLAPFSINVFSAIYIIIQSVRRRVHARHGQTYKKELCAQMKEHQHLIISPLILAILSLPRVIILSLTTCVKTYRNPWLYLSAYFISFLPSVSMFIVFILPSATYKQEFRKSTQFLRQRIRNQINAITPRP